MAEFYLENGSPLDKLKQFISKNGSNHERLIVEEKVDERSNCELIACVKAVTLRLITYF